METLTPSARRRSANLRTHSRCESSSQEYEMNADFISRPLPKFMAVLTELSCADPGDSTAAGLGSRVLSRHIFHSRNTRSWPCPESFVILLMDSAATPRGRRDAPLGIR